MILILQRLSCHDIKLCLVMFLLHFILSILYIYVVDHCVQDGGGSPGH